MPDATGASGPPAAAPPWWRQPGFVAAWIPVALLAGWLAFGPKPWDSGVQAALENQQNPKPKHHAVTGLWYGAAASLPLALALAAITLALRRRPPVAPDDLRARRARRAVADVRHLRRRSDGRHRPRTRAAARPVALGRRGESHALFHRRPLSGGQGRRHHEIHPGHLDRYLFQLPPAEQPHLFHHPEQSQPRCPRADAGEPGPVFQRARLAPARFSGRTRRHRRAGREPVPARPPARRPLGHAHAGDCTRGSCATWSRRAATAWSSCSGRSRSPPPTVPWPPGARAGGPRSASRSSSCFIPFPAACISPHG